MARLSTNQFLSTALLAILLAVSGCAWLKPESRGVDSELELDIYQGVSTKIQYPDVYSNSDQLLAATRRPLTLGEFEQAEFWDLSLEDAIRIALSNSKALTDLGASVTLLETPERIPTVFDPARAETDPRFGVAAALSAFDANWSTQAFFEKNDRALNNQFFGGGVRVFQQDLFNYSSQLSKLAATGGQFTVRHNTDYDFNNAPANLFMNGAWNTNVEAEFRQPLLQGAGVDFNRIAGPGSVPGVYNGVLIARLSADVSLTEFEIGVRNLVNDVETAYWDLYFAYRDLGTKIAARNRAQRTWQDIRAAFDTGRRGGEAENEARAREQYFRLEQEVQVALSGIPGAGRSSITAPQSGIHLNERRLRLLMGLPISDGRLIRPDKEPIMAKVVFNWDEIVGEALLRRGELRQQKWVIKRRELECLAARNFLYPRVDTIGRYRFRGFGHRLLNPAGNRPQFDNAFEDLLSGDFQEWQLGLEVSFPVGYRQAHAAVRNAQLNLAREHAVLEEQERLVIHDLSNAYAEVERAYLTAKTSYNRRLAAREQLAALEARYEKADANERTRQLVDLLLDAQRRLADAESGYFRALAQYMTATKNVHFHKGSLLDYNQVYLTEGAWPDKAYRDAEQRDRLRVRAWRLDNFILSDPPLVDHSGHSHGLGFHDSVIDRHSFASDSNPPPAAEEQVPPPDANFHHEQPIPADSFVPSTDRSAEAEPNTTDFEPFPPAPPARGVQVRPASAYVPSQPAR